MQLKTSYWCWFLVAWAGAGCASGTAEAEADVRHYSDRTASVTTPRASASVETSPETTTRISWQADAITAASPTLAAPDTVSRASEYHEVRHQGTAGVEWEPESETRIDTSYTGSFEPDTVSHTTSLSLQRDLFDQHSTLKFGGRINRLSVGAVDRPDWSRPLWIYGGSTGWTQVLSPTLVGRIDYSLEVRDGFQANPYRYVPIWHADGAGRSPTFALPERLPHRRLRHAWAASANWTPTSEIFLRGNYRFYVDGWSVHSHTLRAAVWWEHPEDWLRLRLLGRGYTQSEASFYEAHYTDVTPFRTGDYRLSTMHSVDAGVRVEFRFAPVPVGSRLTTSAGYDYVHRWLPNYPVFDTFSAHIPSLAIKLEFQ